MSPRSLRWLYKKSRDNEDTNNTQITSAHAAGTYVSSAYGDVTWVKSS